ncbi:nuclear transport factor 2 family protein [Shewanella sp. KX20019]|uniref:nuclear transport factor 2 family protein n=1 Tax=Shewanella sp. KX20019 TaxID=2803864 RepID=UPI001926550F|nr:nuclear transport factor 2 family protein [Shewanella sp. KX20019]QQX81336.1 nuclear transport factor 2 family protein [Shewanella sp. KX20019]
MKTQLLATLLVSTSLLAGCSTLSTDSESTMDISNKIKAVALLNAIETGDSKAIGYVNSNNYTQHNLAVADGLAGFGEVLQALPKGSAKVNVVRAFEDGDYVFTHTDYNFFGPKVGFDLFRFENGQIVEHWDNLAEKAEQPNPSGRTQLDGTTTIVDLDKTAENKLLVADFVETILVNAEYNKLAKYFDGDNYLQHNTAIADGLSGLGQAIEAMGIQGITMEYSKSYKVLGEGNFVLAISEGRFAGEATAYYDLFRVENGKIAEHWDVMETILNKEQWKNTNGKFGNL